MAGEKLQFVKTFRLRLLHQHQHFKLVCSKSRYVINFNPKKSDKWREGRTNPIQEMLTHLKSKRVFGVILWWTSVISHHHNQHDHHHDHNCVTCFSAVKARQDHQRWIEAQTKNSMETFEHDLQHSSPWKHLNHRNNNSNGNIQRWWSSCHSCDVNCRVIHQSGVKCLNHTWVHGFCI